MSRMFSSGDAQPNARSCVASSTDVYLLASDAPHPPLNGAAPSDPAAPSAPAQLSDVCRKRASKRLMSLDALRGLNMLFIIGLSAVIVEICNLCPGSFSDALKTQMTHVEWNGIRHHDTIFPLFLFLAGASFPFSLGKARANGLPTWRIVLKVVYRGLALVLLGVIYNNGVNFDFANLRYGSVLGHIGLGWMFAALLFMSLRRRWLIAISAVVLVGYWLALVLVPAPDVNPPEAFSRAAFAERFENLLTPEKSESIQKNLSMEGSLVGYVDRSIMPGKLYKKVHDPEGLASTLPAIVTALLGMLFGSVLRSPQTDEYRKVLTLFGFGVALTAVGYLWHDVFPINKNLWNSTFVCFVGGCSAIALGLFYLIIDVWGLRFWALAFVVVGANPLAIYLGRKFFDLNYTRDFFFGDAITRFVPDAYQTLATTCAGLLVGWLILLWLYRRRIYIKI